MSKTLINNGNNIYRIISLYIKTIASMFHKNIRYNSFYIMHKFDMSFVIYRYIYLSRREIKNKCRRI